MTNGPKGERVDCTCGTRTVPKYFKMEGLKVRGSECPKCGEIYFNSEDANRLLIFNKIRHEIMSGKVTKAGNSYVLRLPKKLVDALGLTVGSELEISLDSPTKIVLTI
jgi:ribosomal protein S27AE